LAEVLQLHHRGLIVGEQLVEAGAELEAPRQIEPGRGERQPEEQHLPRSAQLPRRETKQQTLDDTSLLPWKAPLPGVPGIGAAARAAPWGEAGGWAHNPWGRDSPVLRPLPRPRPPPSGRP